MFIALVALFLASTAMKKIDMQTKAFSLRFLAEQQAGFDDLNTKFAKLNKRVRRIEQNVNKLFNEGEESPKIASAKN